MRNRNTSRRGNTGRNTSNRSILFDSQSTDHLFSNKNFVNKIRNVNSGITFNANGGQLGTTEVAEFAPLQNEEIWFNKDGIANALSMAKIVDRGNDVVHDSRKEDAFIAYSKDGGYPIKFKRWDNLRAMFPSDVNEVPKKSCQFVETAEENEKMHSARDIQRAKTARNA